MYVYVLGKKKVGRKVAWRPATVHSGLIIKQMVWNTRLLHWCQDITEFFKAVCLSLVLSIMLTNSSFELHEIKYFYTCWFLLSAVSEQINL